MIDLKMILGAVARTFGISSPEDLRTQKRGSYRPNVPTMDSLNHESHVELDKSSDNRTVEQAHHDKCEPK